MTPVVAQYFNNINRLAERYPIAHTANKADEVTVWCSNDVRSFSFVRTTQKSDSCLVNQYLGMGRNPAVLAAMQYVFLALGERSPVLIPPRPRPARPSTPTAAELEEPATSLATQLSTSLSRPSLLLSTRSPLLSSSAAATSPTTRRVSWIPFPRNSDHRSFRNSTSRHARFQAPRLRYLLG